jgi:PII-like signaling protein
MEDSLKLTSYFGERQRAEGRFTADALLDLYGQRRIATSILLRGTEGFGASHRPRTDRSLSLSEDLPLIAVAVDTRSRIEEVLNPTTELIRAGLVTLERARLLTAATLTAATLTAATLTAATLTAATLTAATLNAATLAGADGREDPGAELPETAAEEAVHEATKLTIYLGRQERVDRIPAFVAVCDLLHRRGLAGATALLGVDGTAHGVRERAAFFGRNAATPMMVIAVGSGWRIARVLPELAGLLRRPLLTLERVRICKRDGELLCHPSVLPAADDTGRPLWHKLMVYTSEAALHDGQPIHRAIIRRLRAAGLSGATTQRGIWGFHGDHVPHGDRLLQLGRHVPTVSVVIDAPERIEAAFDIIDDLTSDRGLVTSEAVPAIRPIGRAQPPAGLFAAG